MDSGLTIMMERGQHVAPNLVLIQKRYNFAAIICKPSILQISCIGFQFFMLGLTYFGQNQIELPFLVIAGSSNNSFVLFYWNIY